MLFDDDGDGDHGTGLFEDTRRPRREPEPLSPGMRLAWRLGTFLLLLGFVPLVVWVLARQIGWGNAALGPLTLLALPVSALGGLMIVALVTLSALQALRGGKDRP